MSRQQATKSRGEKGASRGAGGAQLVSAPIVSNDVVPGRMTNADWNKICATDDDDEFVSLLVEEIVETTLDKCYEKYIAKQVLPFTVFKAKDELLDVIEWRFLSHDTGEENIHLNLGWIEDAEPEAGIIDSWAQGSVPIIFTKSPQPVLPPPIEEESEKPDDEQTLDDTMTETVSLGTGLGIQEAEVVEPEPPIQDENKEPEKKPTKKKITFKKHLGRLPSAHLRDMEKTLEHTESELFARELSDLNLKKEPGAHLSPSQKSLLKLQAGRPPGNKEVTFDEKGNVVAVMKLNTKSLPSHKVRVRYSIVDPEAEAAAQRLEAMRTGKLRQLTKIEWKPKSRKTRLSPRLSTNEKPIEDGMAMLPIPPAHRKTAHITGKARATAQSIQKSFLHNRHQTSSRRTDDSSTIIEPLPPSLIESIDASPGVVITEGDQVKVGSKPKPLGSLVQAPVLSDNGTIIGSVTVSTKGNRTLRLLGAASSSSRSDSCNVIRPVLSPSRVVGQNSPTVRSPFSVAQPIPPLSHNSVTSS